MKRIIRNLLVHWQYAAGMFLLFIVELYCITGISDSVYGVRDTGAGKSGIEYMVSDALTSDAWQKAELYMSDSERSKWNDCYEKREDGLYYLRDSFRSQNSLEELEKFFLMPQAVVRKISELDQDTFSDILKENGEPEKTDYFEIRDIMEELLEREGSQEIRRCAMDFVREQSGEAGVDLVRKKTRYLSGSIFLIVLYLLVLGAAVVGMSCLTEYTQRLTGRWIQEPELRSAEQLLMYVADMLFDALLLYLAALYQLGARSAGVWWYAAGLIFLPLCLVFVWMVRSRPELEKLREKLTFSRENGRSYINRLRNIVVAGIPAVTLLAGCTAVISPCFSRTLFMILADLFVAAGVFLLPDIAETADCVEETFSDMDDGEW
ncbi:MAG: hypothetical protein SOW08_00885 [Lachnospiraceae bacterium]|nr:hypothetical protein [Lachnospiraceae bacterium]